MDTVGKTVLTKAQILGAIDVKIEEVDVPEWGGVVHVRSLEGAARDAFEGSRVRMGEKNRVELRHDNTRARLLSKTLCDASGTLLFDEADIEALGRKNAQVLDRLFEVAQRLSAMRPQDLEQKLKNSEAAQTGNLSSD